MKKKEKKCLKKYCKKKQQKIYDAKQKKKRIKKWKWNQKSLFTTFLQLIPSSSSR